jgi:hypothetical protein
MLLPPTDLPEEFLELRIRKGKRVRFYALIPLTQEELNMKLDRGTEALLERFEKEGVSELIHPTRGRVHPRGRSRGS